MAKYGKPETARPKGFFPRLDTITVYAISDRANDRQGNGFAAALRAVARERPNQNAERAAVRSHHLESVRVGIAVVDEDGVVAGHPGPAGNRGHDGRPVADLGARLDTAVEQAADDAFMDEFVAHLEAALGGRCAIRADVPVPQGERSIAFSP